MPSLPSCEGKLRAEGRLANDGEQIMELRNEKKKL
jgi:hypothetical protein